MAYNTKGIKKDVDGRPIPQYFNAQQDQYEALLGQDGAARAILYGPNGQPIGTAGNPLQVKAHDTDTVLGQIKDALGSLATETKLEAVRTLLAALEGKDFATQTTLAQVKQVLDILNIAVEDLKSELNLVKSELANIKANQLSGDQKVQLSGANVEVLASYSETVGAGAFGSSIVITFEGGPYTGFVVGCASDQLPHDFAIEVARMTSSGKYLEALQSGPATLRVTNATRGVSQVHRLIAPKIHFRLRNQSDADHVYDWFILGIRGA